MTNQINNKLGLPKHTVMALRVNIDCIIMAKRFLAIDNSPFFATWATATITAYQLANKSIVSAWKTYGKSNEWNTYNV